jgi:peptidyl-prolyl cis-trans isomerase SurA
MKNSILFLFLCCQLAVIAQSDKAVIDRVVASVGGEIILLSEVQEQYSFAKKDQPTLKEDFQCIILQNLLVQKLLVNQAKLDSVVVKDEEVNAQIDARIERLRAYFNQDDLAIQEFYGQSVDEMKAMLSMDMRNQMLSERMQGVITEKATITPAEVQRFFNDIPKDSLPYFNAEVEIRELVYKPKVSPEEHSKARARLEDIRKQIADQGADFAELAKKFSDDPGSGAQGGDLGFQKRGTFVPEFEAMAYKLETNQLSPIIETDFGFHIIQLLERRGNLIHCRHILIKPEITEADLNDSKSKLDSVRQLIQDGKMTFTDAVKRYGDKNQQSYNNDGRVANPRTGNSFFEVADLETSVFFAIDGLKEGDLAEPFQFKGPDGSDLFRLVQLVSRSKPHKADLKLDYGKIQMAALEQKKSDYTEKWVLEKLNTTYLGISDMFSACPNLQEIIEVSAARRQ